MLDWKKHKLESRYVDDTTLMAVSEEKINNFMMRLKEESEKTGLQLNMKEN